MTYPYYSGLGANAVSHRAEDILPIDRIGFEDPGAYRPHKDLVHAANVALILGMPLLLTGEPGTGKTQFASALASELKCDILKFETKSDSRARDLFYVYDALNAFKMQKETDTREFIRYQALGQAILEAFTRAEVGHLLRPSSLHRGPRRTVVLIDEIDKAPRDFPNDLLNEIDRLYFRIPELSSDPDLAKAGKPAATPGADGDKDADGGLAGVPSKYRPILVLTSNSEKGLPDPFLRRCVYFDIPFPGEDELKEIVAARLQGLSPNDALVADAIGLFLSFRKSDRQRAMVSLKKPPSTAELLNWLQVLRARNVSSSDKLLSQKQLVQETLSALIKSGEDRKIAHEFVEKRWS